MDVDRKEVLRYLGYGRNQADSRVTELIDDCIRQLKAAGEPRHLSKEYPLTLLPDGGIDAQCFQARSRNLSKNLKDCSKIIVFAATLGAGVDLLLHKYNKLQMSRAVVLQAASAAMIEDYCNQACAGLAKEYEAKGYYLRPRFSPGYGDFPLSCQQAVLDGLEAGKRIGIKLTDSFLMIPSKSVTAVMGASRKPYRCEIKGCEACGKADCAYRRES